MLLKWIIGVAAAFGLSTGAIAQTAATPVTLQAQDGVSIAGLAPTYDPGLDAALRIRGPVRAVHAVPSLLPLLSTLLTLRPCAAGCKATRGAPGHSGA